MKKITFIRAAGVALSAAVAGGFAHAQLTPWGAEAGANKQGTIPAYTGGLTAGPTIDRASLRLPDPFAQDKPILTITAANMAEHSAYLSDGLKEMLTRFKTFKIVVYPSHRSVAYPQSVLDNTAKNATRCSLKKDGDELDVSKGCANGFPFPTPKTGYEAIWNMRARYYGPGRLAMDILIPYTKASGEVVITGVANRTDDSGLHFFPGTVPTREWATRSEYTAPTRIAGQATAIVDSLDSTRRAYSYTPATRRVRLAPDLAADTPIASAGGAIAYDEINMFSGSMAKWDVKLVGKREMYIPYNIYMWGNVPGCTTTKELNLAGHYNPDCLRFELHRVWHIQMTLKPGQRHVYSKRDLFIDEDAWYGGITEQYDQQGKLYRMSLLGIGADWEKKVPMATETSISIDFNSGVYVPLAFNKTVILEKQIAPSLLGPDQLDTQLLRATR